jgi:hypothetical protein
MSQWMMGTCLCRNSIMWQDDHLVASPRLPLSIAGLPATVNATAHGALAVWALKERSIARSTTSAQTSCWSDLARSHLAAASHTKRVWI